MNARSPLFLAEEIKLAVDRLRTLNSTRLAPAFWFRDALRAFLKDVDRAQDERPLKKIFAVDSTEVFAAIAYRSSHYGLFTFRGLLSPDGSVSEKQLAARLRSATSKAAIERLDKLILWQLLQGKQKFVLLDAHADEVPKFEHSIAPGRAELHKLNLKPFEGFTPKSLTRLETWIRGQAHTDLIAQEWKEFQGRFLPQWRAHMVEELYQRSTTLNAFDTFMAVGNYLFVRPSTFGNKSLERYAKSGLGVEFDWDAYREFTSREAIVAEFNEVCREIEQLLSVARRINPSFVRTDKQDALAIAQAHILNKFFLISGNNLKLELVTRSETLHAVIASLPAGRLHLTIRHPLLAPDIYNFTSDALDTLGQVLQRVESVVASYLASRQFNESGGSSEVQNPYHTAAQLPDDVQVSMLKSIGEAARETVGLLADLLPIQQTLEQEQKASFITPVYSRSIRHGQDQAGETPARIRVIFDLLREQLAQRDDPFTAAAFAELTASNRRLIQFDGQRTFDPDSKLHLRLVFFEQENSIVAAPCVAIRPTNSNFRRLFHIHSERITKLLRSTIRNNQPSGRSLPPGAIDADIGVEEIFELADSALAAITERSASQLKGQGALKRGDDVVFNLDATLLASIMFASCRRFDTAVSLLSNVLHVTMAALRTNHRGIGEEPARLRAILATRELLLLRHYCERAIAMDDAFPSGDFPNVTSASINKNFARAQRDLDLAAYMSEQAEVAMSGGKERETRPAPAGAAKLMDYRLRLAHLGGWMDQFLLLALKNYINWPTIEGWEERQEEQRRRRLDIWTAAGLVKEISTDAYFARARRLALADSDESIGASRYLAHVEARALQSALTMFLLFLSFRIAPDLHHYWRTGVELTAEQSLVFKDWERWWTDYRLLCKDFDFQMQMPGLLEPTLATIKALRNGSVEASSLLQDLEARIDEWQAENTNRTFMHQVSVVLKQRVVAAKAVL